MRTEATAAPVLPPEELAWDAPVVFHAESRAGDGAGFLLRLHTDPACPLRLVPEGLLVSRRYDRARADALCPTCAAATVPTSTSTVVRRLRDAARTLDRLRAAASAPGAGPMPREVVHVRALRYEAQHAVSVHPDAPRAAEAVVTLADEVAEALRHALTSYDRRR